MSIGIREFMDERDAAWAKHVAENRRDQRDPPDTEGAFKAGFVAGFDYATTHKEASDDQ